MNLVILDSGHARNTAGKVAIDKSLYEWDFNNSMQYKIKKLLENYNIMVYLTNPNPGAVSDIGLTQRSTLANNYWSSKGKPKAIFISLHANAYGGDWNGARGVETYHANNSSTNSKTFARTLNDEIYATCRNIDGGFKNRGVKSEDFTVIYKTSMPSVLVEYGFYTNKDDLSILKNKQDDLCEATVRAICKYFGISYAAVESKKDGWHQYGDKWSYMQNGNWIYSQWIFIDGKHYYIDSEGYMVTGWLKESDKWYYLNSNGSMATGWINVSGKDYYLHENGVMENKHIDINGMCYHFAENGELIKTISL